MSDTIRTLRQPSPPENNFYMESEGSFYKLFHVYGNLDLIRETLREKFEGFSIDWSRNDESYTISFYEDTANDLEILEKFRTFLTDNGFPEKVED